MKKILSVALLFGANLIVAQQPTLVCVTKMNSNMQNDTTRVPEQCKVIAEVAEALTAIQQELESLGLGLKIFEAYCEPCEEACLETPEGNIAVPDECNRHCRGTSVDVTLLDQNGNELDMGTPFDEFTERAKPTFMDLEEQVLKNRQILQYIMLKHGFVQSELVWWHFDIHGWENYELACCEQTNP